MKSVLGGEGEGGGGRGWINPFLPMKAEQSEVRAGPGCSSGWLCCDKLTARSSAPGGSRPKCAGLRSHLRGPVSSYVQHLLPGLSLRPSPPTCKLSPVENAEPGRTQGSADRRAVRAALRVICVLFAPSRSAADRPGSGSVRGWGSWESRTPPVAPPGSGALRPPARRKRLCAVCFENSPRPAMPALICAAQGWSPAQCLSFHSSELRDGARSVPCDGQCGSTGRAALPIPSPRGGRTLPASRSRPVPEASEGPRGTRRDRRRVPRRGGRRHSRGG